MNNAVEPPRCRRNAACAGTVSSHDKSNPEDQSAEDLRNKVCRGDGYLSIIQQAQPRKPERSEHGRDDGDEHHLENPEIGEVELRGELSRTAESRPFKKEAETDADEKRNEEARIFAEESELVERSVHSHCLRKKYATA